MSLKHPLNSSITLAAVSIIISSVLFVLVSSSGCADDEIINYSGIKTVSGKIYGAQGQTLAGVNVSINYGQAVVTSADGTFRFYGVEPPYDLNIFQKNNNGFFYQYRGLTTLNPEIELQVIGIGPNPYHAMLELKYPRLPSGHSIICKLISSVNSEVLFSMLSDTSGFMFISWGGPSVVNGELAFLQVIKDEYGRITSYEKFGKKSITVQDGGEYDERFIDSDLPLNPVEKNVQIAIPGIYVNPNIQANLLIKSFPWGSGFELIRYGNVQPQNIVVPANLGYSVKIEYEMIPNDTSSLYTISARGFMEPGENYIMPLPPLLSQIYPSEDTIGVNYNTVFSHNLSGNVYEFIIGNYTVFTTNSMAQIPIGNLYGIELPSNQQMTWSVAVHNITNMDEIVKQRDMLYPTMHRVRVETAKRLFRTEEHN